MKTVTELIPKPKTSNDFLHAAWHMESLGEFAACIAQAYYAADLNNRNRLQAAFPELFTQGYHQWLRDQVLMKV